MHDGTEGLNGAEIAGLRIFSAGLVCIPFALFHFTKIPPGKRGTVILSAVFGNLIPTFLFAESISRLDESLAGILNSLTPICVVVIGITFFRDKIKKQKLIGVLTGLAGLILLTFLPLLLENKTISFDHLTYTILIFIATLLYGINVNMVSHYLQGVNPVHIATVSLSFMTLPAGLVLLQQGFTHLDFSNPVVQRSIASSCTLGIAGSAIATVLFYMLVHKAGALFASLVTYGIPFIALLWGFIDGEKITWLEIVCLAIILVGVYLANRKIPKEINDDRNVEKNDLIKP
jgi:drug/metabolite transporter (DMT)-like permease